MTLAALIRKRGTGKPANANPAKAANDEQVTSRPLAGLAALALATPANPELFTFTPPGDPANDDEALAERTAIMAEGNGWTEAQALQEARWQADKERCWRSFLRSAERILTAPEGERAGLLAIYAAEASRRYGAAVARDMAGSMRSWIDARPVH